MALDDLREWVEMKRKYYAEKNAGVIVLVLSEILAEINRRAQRGP